MSDHECVYVIITHLTSVCDASVFAQEADLLFLLCHNLLVFRPEAVRVSGEYEGITIQAGSVLVKLSAGVVDGVVVVVGVNDPVVIICGTVTNRSDDLTCDLHMIKLTLTSSLEIRSSSPVFQLELGGVFGIFKRAEHVGAHLPVAEERNRHHLEMN